MQITSPQAETPATKQMCNLHTFVGKEVTVVYASQGKIETAKGILISVDEFISIEVSVPRNYIAFVGTHEAIRSITFDGEDIFHNPNVDEKYTLNINREEEEELPEVLITKENTFVIKSFGEKGQTVRDQERKALLEKFKEMEKESKRIRRY